MGFLYQLPAIVGGTVLVIERVESQNFSPGLFGWAIYANGNAEFNNVVVRGSLITGATGSQHIEVNGASAPQGVAFFTGDAAETFPGVIQPQADASELSITMSSPLVTGHAGAALVLATGKPGNRDRLSATADVVDITGNTLNLAGPSSSYLLLDNSGGVFGDLNAPTIFLRDTSLSNTDGVAVVGQSLTGIVKPINQAWITTPLVNAWVDVAGARFGYTKDATGRVQLRGEVISGTAAQITTLPAGYRPTQSMEWVMRAQGGVVLCAVFVSTTGAVTVTANVASAQSGGVRLDSISFPTL